MALDKFTRRDRQIGIAAIVLLISLLFFPWHHYSYGPFSASLSGTSAPDGWLGILAVIVLVALLADLLIERLSPQTSIPPLGGGREATRLILAGATTVLLVLKFLFHINHFGWGFIVDALATGALIYSALEARRYHDAGTGLSSRTGSGTGTGSGTSTSTGSGTGSSTRAKL